MDGSKCSTTCCKNKGTLFWNPGDVSGYMKGQLWLMMTFMGDSIEIQTHVQGDMEGEEGNGASAIFSFPLVGNFNPSIEHFRDLSKEKVNQKQPRNFKECFQLVILFGSTKHV